MTSFLAWPWRRLWPLLALISAVATPARAELEVFEGFMDEEVKFVLERLIRENPNRRVVVLERSRPTEDMLFELPVAVYGQKPTRRLVDPTATGDGFEARWSRALGKELATAEPKLKASVVEGKHKPKTNVGGEKFELLTFNGTAPVSAENPPIVLVRSPEMGLQPALVPIYQKAIVTSLQSLSEGKPESGGLKYSFFGTSGAVASHEQPGDLNRVTGSVYVGVDLVPGKDGAPAKYRGVIRLIDTSGRPPKTFYASEEFDNRAQAEAAATKTFNSPGVASLATNEGQTLGQEVRSVMQTHGGSVSLTVSFFGSDAEKNTGRSLGLTNVNMEDYHVFTSMPELLRRPKEGTVDVVRYNCDPPEIPANVVNAMEKWGEKSKYTTDAYVDAMLWGLKGSIAEQSPESAAWNALDGFEKGLRSRYAFQMPDGKILDPFYSEIASDFLSTILKGKAFGIEIFSLKAVEGLSDAQRKELGGLLETKSKALAAEAAAIYASFSKEFKDAKLSVEAEKALRAQLRALVEKTRYLEIPDGPLRRALAENLSGGSKTNLLTDGKLRMLGSPDGNMEVWVRSGKWKGNVSMTLEHLLHDIDVQKLQSIKDPELRAKTFRDLVFGSPTSSLDGANADRALYKTGLVGGLPNASREHVLRERFRDSLRNDANYQRELKEMRPALDRIRQRVCG